MPNPKVDKVLHLINVKAEKLAEGFANEQHRSLSHLPKERREQIIDIAKGHIADLLIRQLNKI